MSKRKLILAILPILALLGAAGGFAYWTTFGSGSAAASVGSLTAPGQPSVPISSGTVNLSWTAGTVSGGGTVLYHVERRNEPGAVWTSVCASSDAAPIAGLSCSDTPGTGTFVYRVTSRYASWHTTGPESDPVLGDAPPYVISIDRDDADPTNAATLSWTVTFSESVTGVDAADFVLAAIGVTGASITGLTGSGATYTVTAGGVAGDGTLGLNLDDDDSIIDSASNPLGSVGVGNGDFTGQVYTVDQTVPTVTVNQKAGQADPTNALPILFTVAFSEPVTGFDASDLTRGGTATGGSVGVTGAGSSYEIAVTGSPTDGTISFSIDAATALDLAGNGNSPSTSTDNTVTYDTAAPSVLLNQEAGQADPTNALPILYTVTFSEPVTGFDATDLTRTGSSTGGIVAVTGSGAIYEIAVTGTPTNGTIVFTIAANRALDLAGNNNTASASTDNSVTYDTVAPSVTINQAVGQADPTNASPINFTVVFSESTTTFATGDVTLTGGAGATTATVTGSGTTYNVAVTGMTGQGTVIGSIAAGAASDAAGNNNTASASTDNSVTYDTVAPSVTINQAVGQADPTNASPINFTVVFSESTTTFATGDVTLTGGAGATTATVTGSGTTYNVAVTGMTGQGTVIGSIAAGAASDAAGNANTASTSTDNSVTYDTVAPSVTINQAVGQADPTNASPINFTVVFSESTTTFATGDVTLTGGAGATTATVTGSSTTYNVAVTGMTADGTVIAAIAAGVATDAAGNTNTASTSTDNTVTRETVSPTVTLTAPANNSFTTDTTPTLNGTAGNTPGDSTTITITIYNGTGTGGTVAQTLTPTRTAATWTTTATTLAQGTYTAQATQTDTAGNTGTSTANTFTIDTTVPTVTNVLLTNGGTIGRATEDDTVVVTYNEAMDASSFCSTWANDGTDESLSGNNQVVVTITNNASNDTLSVTASGCTFLFGSIALNANYVTSTVSFSGTGSNASRLDWNAAARTLTITLGNGNGQSTGIAASIPSYTANTGLRDRAGNAITAGPYSGTSSRF